MPPAEQLYAENLSLKSVVIGLHEEIARLKVQLDWLKQRLFGPGRGETLDRAQLLLQLEGLEKLAARLATQPQIVTYERTPAAPAERTNPAAHYVAARHVSFAHNSIDRNLLWHAGRPIHTGQKKDGVDAWAAWQATGMDRHSVIADPQFVDPARDDYRLRATSPAFALGFKPIPVEKIGPFASPDRATWPIVEAEGAREHPTVTP
jgi:hypothetical protein